MGSKWVQTGFRLGSEWVQSRFRLGSEWVQGGFKVGSDWVRSGFRMGYEWVPSGHLRLFRQEHRKRRILVGRMGARAAQAHFSYTQNSVIIAFKIA